MKPILPLLILTAALAQAEPVEVNAIAARVQGAVVTKNEVAFMLAPMRAQLSAQYPRRGAEHDKLLGEARAKILDELIDRELIMFEFKTLGANIPPRVIQEEVDRQINELYNGNEEKFREELGKARLTMEGYREITRRKLIVSAMRSRKFSDSAPPTPSEVQAEYNETKSAMRDISKDKVTFMKIFIPREGADMAANAEAQLALAESIAKQINEGTAFEELAKQHSADAFAAEGGKWPQQNRADLSPEFAGIIFDAPLNELKGPLEDPAGFTVIKVLARELGPAPAFAKVRDLMEERVRRKKSATRYDAWMAGLRKRAWIEKK
jgi:peptidyl-prolyl cis-trans isomerase SurA